MTHRDHRLIIGWGLRPLAPSPIGKDGRKYPRQPTSRVLEVGSASTDERDILGCVVDITLYSSRALRMTTKAGIHRVNTLYVPTSLSMEYRSSGAARLEAFGGRFVAASGLPVPARRWHRGRPIRSFRRAHLHPQTTTQQTPSDTATRRSFALLKVYASALSCSPHAAHDARHRDDRRRRRCDRDRRSGKGRTPPGRYPHQHRSLVASFAKCLTTRSQGWVSAALALIGMGVSNTQGQLCPL